MQDLYDLYQRSEVAVRLAELHDLVYPILNDLAQALGYARVFVALVDPGREIVEGAAGVNVPDDVVEAMVQSVDGVSGPLVLAMRSGRLIRYDDITDEASLSSVLRQRCLASGMTAFVVIPLVTANAVLVAGREAPSRDKEIADIFPYAARVAGVLAEQSESRRLRDSGTDAAAEKEWLWSMVDAVPDPILVSDDHNEALLFNVAAERLFVSRAEDSEGKRHAIQFNNVLLSAALSRFALGQADGLVRELTLVDPIEGTDLTYEVISKPLTNLRSGESGLVSVLKNVTDLRRAAEEVQKTLADLQVASEEARRERDRLNLVIENVADPIVVTDPSGQVMLMNELAERLFQGPLDLDPQPSTIYLTNLAQLSFFLSQLGLDSAPLRSGEIQLIDPATGEELTMGVTATEVPDSLHQVTAVVSVLHDLTRLRELEQRRVERQLFESQKLAAVGRLAATVAHEINNPLEAIKNSLHLLVSDLPTDDSNHRFLEIASRETDRVSRIIRQMLGFYQPAGDRELVNLNKILEEALGLFERPLRLSRIKVQYEPDAVLPPVVGSPDQLKQVFLNFLLNAQEAMPHGGVLTVTTRVSRADDPEFATGSFVLVRFRDTGVGIPDEALPHIFEPFYSTKTAGRGTGLGLWVSHGIIHSYGGRITVRTRPGHGTTFTIALPPEEAQ